MTAECSVIAINLWHSVDCSAIGLSPLSPCLERIDCSHLFHWPLNLNILDVDEIVHYHSDHKISSSVSFSVIQFSPVTREKTVACKLDPDPQTWMKQTHGFWFDFAIVLCWLNTFIILFWCWKSICFGYNWQTSHFWCSTVCLFVVFFFAVCLFVSMD